MRTIYRVKDDAGNWIADFSSAYEAQAFCELLDYETTVTQVFKIVSRSH